MTAGECGNNTTHGCKTVVRKKLQRVSDERDTSTPGFMELFCGGRPSITEGPEGSPHGHTHSPYQSPERHLVNKEIFIGKKPVG